LGKRFYYVTSFHYAPLHAIDLDFNWVRYSAIVHYTWGGEE